MPKDVMARTGIIYLLTKQKESTRRMLLKVFGTKERLVETEGDILPV